MDTERLMRFMLERDMIVKKMSLFKESKFYPFTNKIQIAPNKDSVWLVHFLHESIHRYLNNLPLCDIQMDYVNLFCFLHHFYLEKKTEIFRKAGMFKLEKEDGEYDYQKVKDYFKFVITDQSELDKPLARNREFVDFCKFCIQVFDIYNDIKQAQLIFYEGFATYYCIHACPGAFIFELMHIPDIFEIARKRGISNEEIEIAQADIRETILKQGKAGERVDVGKMDIYEFGYSYTDLLSEKYGDNYLLLVLFYMMSQIFNIYDVDLLNSSPDSRQKAIRTLYSFDTMYFNLVLRMDKILPILLKLRMGARKSIELFRLVTNHKYPGRDLDGAELAEALDKNFFRHPVVVGNIEKVIKRPMTDEDYGNAYVHMIMQRSGKSMRSFLENDAVSIPDTDEFEEIRERYSDVFLSKTDKYAEENLLNAYYGMKRIVNLAERLAI